MQYNIRIEDMAVEKPETQEFIKEWIIDELEEKIGHGNWCLSTAFFYGNLCFINQVDGGDEWLTIKDDYAFESFTFSRIIKDGRFKGYIERLLAAMREQCIELEY